MATGNGLARAMHGCRGIGSSVRDRPRSGLRVAGCATPAAGLGFPVTGSKRIQAIDKIDCIAKEIDLLDVAVNAFLPSRASILRAIRPSEASCCSGTRCALSELFPQTISNNWRGELLRAVLPRRRRTSVLHYHPTLQIFYRDLPAP